MLDEESSDTRDAAIAHVVYLHDQSIRRKRIARKKRRDRPSNYRMKLGRETIWLSTIEYRIIRFLAASISGSPKPSASDAAIKQLQV